jgi:DNA-binding transcriptional ArsR family regulator
LGPYDADGKSRGILPGFTTREWVKTERYRLADLETKVDALRDPRKYLRVLRKSLVLDALFPAIRQQILAATLLEPEKWWYLTELASHLGTSPSSLQRELGALTRSGLLEHRQDGRRTYYKANTASPVFSELHELFGKTAGIIPTLQ